MVHVNCEVTRVLNEKLDPFLYWILLKGKKEGKLQCIRNYLD